MILEVPVLVLSNVEVAVTVIVVPVSSSASVAVSYAQYSKIPADLQSPPSGLLTPEIFPVFPVPPHAFRELRF